MKEILNDPRLALLPDAPSEQIESQLNAYLDLLVKWNQKINLTSEKTPTEILHRHIFDSLQYARVISSHDKIIDIGSGAGFPGIPLKIVYPGLILALVESQRKRCSFLEAVVHKLDLKNVRVINERAEKIPDEQVGKVDAVLLRAVSDIKSCLEFAVRFLEKGGKVVLKKSPEETPSSSHSAFSLIEEVEVTGYNDKKSSLLVFEKCST